MRFRRRETLNERLLRQGHLMPERESLRPSWDKVGVHGLHRLREWDEVVTVAAEVAGDAAHFVVLDEEIVIDDGPDDVEPLADAVTLEPPFRAEARRVGDRLWSVGARRIRVAELPGLSGEELVFVSRDGFTDLDVDGSRVLGTVPQLQRDGDYVVRGTRLAGQLWEVEEAPL